MASPIIPSGFGSAAPTPRALVLLALLASGLGGCSTTNENATLRPSTPAELLRAEDELLRPLRSRSVVIADRVVVQISPNFYAKLSRPPGGARRAGEACDEILWNVGDPVLTRQQGDHGAPGTRANPTVPVGVSELEFVIEGTIFLVTDHLRLKVFHSAPPTLQISASGDVRLLTERATKEERFAELRFNDGKVYGKRHQG